MMSTLKIGSRGADVRTLQSRLALHVDGIFGPLTEEAVKEFQSERGLTPDGIVGPETWTALGVNSFRRTIKKIIVHCTATPDGRDFSVDEIRRCHLQRGFSDIGYHYVVYRDGSVHPGRPEAISGAHCSGHNSTSIGVCYVGGCPPEYVKDWQHKGLDTRTPEQKIALRKLVAELQKKYPGATVHGHYEFANKLCPSFKICDL